MRSRRFALALLGMLAIGGPSLLAAQEASESARDAFSVEALPASLRPESPGRAVAVQAAAPSPRRHLAIGAGGGALVGAAFGLAVAGFADCGGPKCTGERVTGVAMNTTLGAALGAAIGGVTYLVRR